MPSSRPSRRAKHTGFYRVSKSYIVVSNEKRQELIDLISTKGMRICDAARACQISYENAKVINQVYRKEGRTNRHYSIS